MALMLPLCTLSCCCLCKVCFRRSHVCHMCSVQFLPVYGLFKCFRSSHACHMCLDLFLPVQSLLTCMTALHWAYLCQMHRPIVLHRMHYGTTLWARIFIQVTVLHTINLQVTSTNYMYAISLPADFSAQDHTLENKTDTNKDDYPPETYASISHIYLSELVAKDSHKRLSSTENHNTTCSKSRYLRITERYTETLHVKKMAD